MITQDNFFPQPTTPNLPLSAEDSSLQGFRCGLCLRRWLQYTVQRQTCLKITSAMFSVLMQAQAIMIRMFTDSLIPHSPLRTRELSISRFFLVTKMSISQLYKIVKRKMLSFHIFYSSKPDLQFLFWALISHLLTVFKGFVEINLPVPFEPLLWQVYTKFFFF